MGSAQSTLSTEAIFAGAAVAGSAVAYLAYNTVQPGSKSEPNPAEKPPHKSQTLKRGKKKTADAEFDSIIAAAAAEDKAAAAKVPKSQSVAFPNVVPGGFESAPVASDTDAAAKAKKAQKKKKAKKTSSSVLLPDDTASSTPKPATTPVPAVSDSEPEPRPASKKEKKKKAKKAAGSVHGPSSPAAGSSKAGGQVDITDDGPWTRVDTRRRQPPSRESQLSAQGDLTTSATSVTETSSAATEKSDDDEEEASGDSVPMPGERRRTFVEKMLPKPRKTGVEDMVETPLYPELSRVIRVAPGPDEKPLEGYTWDDYEDVASSADDGGWGVVKSKKRSKIERTSSDASTPNTQPRAAAPDAQTQRQRQNAARREAQKTEKDAAEADRLQRLAAHKRVVERTKMEEQFKTTSSKKVGGGMSASVDENGKLVFE